MNLQSSVFTTSKLLVNVRKGRLLVVMTLVCLGTACAQTSATTEPSVSPTPPSIYRNLPQIGRADCLREADVRVDTPLWQYPGLSSPKDDSGGSSRSITGDAIAFVPPCGIVRVLEFQWSHQDKQFYLLVEYDKKRGWAMERYIEVPYLTATK